MSEAGKMSDLIERQAAIDGVKTLHEVAWKNWHEPTLSSNVVIDMIKDLPSARPDPSQVARDIADIIENEKDMRVIARSEIIRCKDCKFYSPMNREAKIGICNLTMHQNFGDIWFCAGAERRTDEGLD